MCQLLSLDCQCSALTKELQPQCLTPLIISRLFERYIEGALQCVIYFFNYNRCFDNFTKEMNKLLKFIFCVLHDLCAEVRFLLLLFFFIFNFHAPTLIYVMAQSETAVQSA